MYTADGVDQVRRRSIFEEIAHGPRAHAAEDVIVAVKRGQDNDPGLRPGRTDGRGCFDAIELWKLHVHEDDVGPQLQRRRHTRLAIAGFAYHLQAGLQVEDGLQPLTHQGLVFHQQNANRLHVSVTLITDGWRR